MLHFGSFFFFFSGLTNRTRKGVSLLLEPCPKIAVMYIFQDIKKKRDEKELAEIVLHLGHEGKSLVICPAFRIKLTEL